MKDPKRGSTIISFPNQLYDDQDRVKATDSTPSELKLPKDPMQVLFSTSKSSINEKEEKDVILDEFLRPHCVSTSSSMITTHSPVSTLTPERNLSQTNDHAIDLSLRFLSGNPPDSHSRSLQPGIQYQMYSDLAPFQLDKYMVPTNHPIMCIPKKSEPRQQQRSSTQSCPASSIDFVEKSVRRNANKIHGAYMPSEGSRHETRSLPYDFASSDTLPNDTLVKELNSSIQEKTKKPQRNIDGEEDPYESLEHTLSDFEDTVATLSEADSESVSSTTEHSCSEIRPTFYDPTGLLSAVDRMLDCLDPRWTGEERSVSPTSDEKTLDSRHHADLEWEVAMERDGMEWLFPCCDDSGFDKECEDFFEDSSVEDPSRIHGSLSECDASRYPFESKLQRNVCATDDCNAKIERDQTMLTDTDITIDLSD